MGTITITAAGFANFGASPPANWRSSQATFPANGSPNGAKTYTINDADWLALLTWVAASQFQPTASVPATPTAPQIVLAWLLVWINGTKQAVQQFNTTPPGAPPPIGIS
jgi:hypothetical protein